MYKRLLLILAGLSLLTGCGGGGSSPTSANSAQDVQKTWVRGHLDDVYLWYDEIISVPPSSYATAPDYFDALLVKSRDRFSFSLPLAKAVSGLQGGLETGYGVKWGWAATGRLYAYYVDPNSPAAAAITRGSEVKAINGQAVATASSSYVNGALYPGQTGVPLNLTFRVPGTDTTRITDISSATFSTTTVEPALILTLAGGAKAGYLLFNEHLSTSEAALIAAVTFLKQQRVGELVLDLRYNSGGYLYIARELASMVAGASVQGKVFEKLLFNGKHPEKTYDPQYTFTFTAQDSKGAPLPMLGLSRVFVLTGPNTCSASEAVINGLLPHVQVVLIGGMTCGKPYGSIQTDYDQQAYFALQFEGVNANGTDDYKSGFSPTCPVSDDLNNPLGDSREARLNAALYYMGNGSCPPTAAVTLPKRALTSIIPISGDAQLIERKPGLKLLK